MADIWKIFMEKYTYLFYDLSQPLTRDWLFVGSPLPLLGILIAYNIICTKIGPMLMKNRQPYKLEKTIKLYNIFQVLISLYITYEGCVCMFVKDFDFRCQAPHEGDERTARGIQLYFLTKLTELLDTIFFVLRKSDRQITFLHLYHHTLMSIISWVGVKYIPGGQGVLFGTINSFVHVVMYTYYFISGLGPQYRKYLWWKKYLTVLQIVQFFIVFAHSVNSLFYSCGFFHVLKVVTIIFSSIFMYMFSKFYYINYIATKSKDQTSVVNGNNSKSNESNGNTVSDKKPIFNDGHANGVSNSKLSSNDLSKTKNGHKTFNGSNHTKDNAISTKRKHL